MFQSFSFTVRQVTYIVRQSCSFHATKIYQHTTLPGLPTNTDHRYNPNADRMRQGIPTKRPVDNVKHIVVVSSGKGGVGKSTVAINLAIALSHKHQSVGLLDTDIYGPSIPRLMNLSGTEVQVDESNRLLPLSNHGIQCMSMGFLVNEDQPIVWRGMMVMKSIEQLLRHVNWGMLDILVVDMPPGTGDTQLTLTQQVPISGAVIVSTPQDIALVDVVKGANMFKKVDVPIIGLVENMAHYTCPKCQHTSHIFGQPTNLDAKAKLLSISVIGRIPLTQTLCETSDSGKPIVAMFPNAPESLAFLSLADHVIRHVYQQPR